MLQLAVLLSVCCGGLPKKQAQALLAWSIHAQTLLCTDEAPTCCDRVPSAGDAHAAHAPALVARVPGRGPNGELASQAGVPCFWGKFIFGGVCLDEPQTVSRARLSMRISSVHTPCRNVPSSAHMLLARAPLCGELPALSHSMCTFL